MNIALGLVVTAGALLLTSVLAAGALRLQTLVRLFAASAWFLALLIAGIGWLHGDEHFYAIAVATVAFKAIVIPMLILHSARSAGVSGRLRSYLRPASTYFLLLGIIAFVLIGVHRSPFAAHTDVNYLLALAVALVLIGLFMMVVRRDILSQMLGFLTMENGVAAFSYATVSSLPVLIELGVVAAVTIGVFLMSFLSAHVQRLYGTEDTDVLRELTEDAL
ncbi:MAG: hypothetical protein Q7T01_04670 [bacterium]|nr:hypothetical protein [bacterium]